MEASLEGSVQAFLNACVPSPDYLRQLEALFQFLQKTVLPPNEKTLVGFRLMIFGSVAQSLASQNCDLDVCIAPGLDEDGHQLLPYADREDNKWVLRQVYGRVTGAQIGQTIFIGSARVPIVKYQGLRWPHFDISANPDGVLKSYNLRKYIVAPENIAFLQPLLRLVVGWCKQKGFLAAWGWFAFLVPYF